MLFRSAVALGPKLVEAAFGVGRAHGKTALRAAMRGNSLPIYSVLLVAYLALALLIVAGMRGLERLARRRLGMGPVRA